VGERTAGYRVLLQEPEGRKPLGRLKIILKTDREQGRRTWTGLIWLRIGTGVWALVNTATNFWSHKMLTILEQMRQYEVLQKASVHTVSQ
jgi:hypothetical protein